jgi:hypothetical protein
MPIEALADSIIMERKPRHFWTFFKLNFLQRTRTINWVIHLILAVFMVCLYFFSSIVSSSSISADPSPSLVFHQINFQNFTKKAVLLNKTIYYTPNDPIFVSLFQNISSKNIKNTDILYQNIIMKKISVEFLFRILT